MEDLAIWQNISGSQKALYSVAIVLGAWLVWLLATRLVNRQFEDVHVRYRVRKTVTYLLAGLSLAAVAALWLEDLASLATLVGLVSAGIAIALRDVLVNVAGWLYIVWRRPFRVGDRVETGGLIGDVVDIRVLHFQLLEVGNWVASDQSTGRIVHVPCGIVLSQPLHNYSEGFQYIWNEIPVLLTFESHWQDAKELLLAIADRHSEHLSQTAEEQVRAAGDRMMIYYETLTPRVYTAVRETGVELTVRYLCAPHSRRNTEEAIWEDVLREFHVREDIEFAYPTRRTITETREAADSAHAD
jgi:small-conductance mechanosensitive channel